MEWASGGNPSLQTQLHDLLDRLRSLGTELPQCLVSLTQVVQPQIPNEMRIPLLGKMFAEVPSVVSAATPQQLQQIVLAPPPDAVALRLLLDLRQVQQILQNISYLQLLHLTNGLIPPGSPQAQLKFLNRVQEIFQMWSNNTLELYHKKLAETPVHLERQQLLALEPKISPDAVHLVCEMLKLPRSELLPFKHWIEALPQTHVILLVNLLQMEPQVLIEIKKRLTTNPQQGSEGEQSMPNVSSLLVTSGVQPMNVSLGMSSNMQPVAMDTNPLALSDADLGAVRIGKRDRGGIAKEVVNIRTSGLLDNALGPGDNFDDELVLGTEEHGDLPTAKRGPAVELGTSSIIMPPMGMDMMDSFSDPNFTQIDLGMDLGDIGFGQTLGNSWGLGMSQRDILAGSVAVPRPHDVDMTPSHENQQQQHAEDVPMDEVVVASDPHDVMSPSEDESSADMSVVQHQSLGAAAAANRMTSAIPSTVATPGFSLQQLQPALQLRIAKQPPAKTVYQRILKPFPAVMLLGSAAADTTLNLFVEATLMRSDSDKELPSVLEGNKVIRISQGVFATFKRLKVLSTSQQQGTLFRLRFVLKRYVANTFEYLPETTILSNPIEVFSHTQYLTSKKGGAPPTPPTVMEILPNIGSSLGGTKVAILGANFVHSPNLKVQCIFHESGTLVCQTPPSVPNQTVEVRVSNDGQEFCASSVRFSYVG